MRIPKLSVGILRIFLAITVVLVPIALLSSCAAAPGDEAAEGGEEAAEVKYHWKFAHVDQIGGGNLEDMYGNWFKDRMEEWSDGQIEITISGGRTLGEKHDILEQVQAGSVEFTTATQGDFGTFVPETGVFSLHFLWPTEQASGAMAEVSRSGNSWKMLQDKAAAKNLLPVALGNAGWSWWSSSIPIRNMDDMQGWKIRVMPDKMLVEAFKAYGCNPTPLPWGELFSALQTGLVEGQSNPLFYGWSESFYEVQDYFTNPRAELLYHIPVVNPEFLESLPDDMAATVVDVMIDLMEDVEGWTVDQEGEIAALILGARPEVEITEWAYEETIPLRERAVSVDQVFIDEVGGDAEQILNALREDVENAKEKLGVE